jgi:uncharacterized membrane protein
MSENTPSSAKPVNPSLLKPTTVYLFLAYFLWPFGLIGLKIEREDDFIRFNCAQAMAFFFLQLVIGFLSVFSLIPFIGLLFMPLVYALFVATYVFVIIALIKAAKGEKYLLPLLGSFAQKYIQKWFIK